MCASAARSSAPDKGRLAPGSYPCPPPQTLERAPASPHLAARLGRAWRSMGGRKLSRSASALRSGTGWRPRTSSSPCRRCMDTIGARPDVRRRRGMTSNPAPEVQLGATPLVPGVAIVGWRSAFQGRSRRRASSLFATGSQLVDQPYGRSRGARTESRSARCMEQTPPVASSSISPRHKEKGYR